MIWENNTEFIREHNEMANEGYHTFTLKINKYGDMVLIFAIFKYKKTYLMNKIFCLKTNKEFNQILNHLNTDKISRFPNPISCKEPDRIVNAKIPESIDWK